MEFRWKQLSNLHSKTNSRGMINAGTSDKTRVSHRRETYRHAPLTSSLLHVFLRVEIVLWVALHCRFSCRFVLQFDSVPGGVINRRRRRVFEL